MVCMCMMFTALCSTAQADETGEKEKYVKLDDVVVEAEGEKQCLTPIPEGTMIKTDDLDVIGEAASVLDYIDKMAIIDFNGITDLTPDEDTITMRGFSSGRFVTAIDGLTSQKTGGRKGSHIVDYALMPAFLIDRVEILPGPHSALYDAKAIGGVVNMVTKAPKLRDSLVPEIQLKASYSSYNTLNTNVNMSGAARIFTYDVGYQKNSTDGFLRQSATDIQTLFTRLGVILPMDGYITVSGSFSAADRETPVNNNIDTDDYDLDYPDTEGSLFDPYQKPTWNKDAWAYRLNYLQNLPIGKLSVVAYTSKEDRDRASWDWIDSDDTSLGLEYTSWVTTWRQHGGKIMDKYTWTANHITTVGIDMAQLYDGDDDDERVDKRGAFLQHQWGIISALDLKLGARYEHLELHVSNTTERSTGDWAVPNQGAWIVRDWGQIIPKSFLTWKMSTLGETFRDTTLSVGVSKIWHAPDSHGEYNPQGKPAGAWLDPEHGVGYDLIFMRRLFGDVNFKVDYSFYDIKDYIISNKKYAEESQYRDYKINLEEVYRHGVETELDGNVMKDLSFYLTYAWQEYENQGDEPAGKDGLDNLPEHRVSAGLRYNLFEKTTLMLDYQYRSKEVTENSDEIEDPVTHEVIDYTWFEVENPSLQLINIGAKQTLYKSKGLLKDAVLSVYVKNLFDEEYFNTRGYPATDRTYGASLSLSIH